MFFTGETIDADQAVEIGLVSKVVEPDNLMDAAMKLADKVAANPVRALRLTKRLLPASSASVLRGYFGIVSSISGNSTRDYGPR